MRIVIVSDLHCGSSVGLTPLAGNVIQKKLYERWSDCIAHLGSRPDLLICNGDAIDGLQTKGRSAEDRDWIPRQVDHSAMLLAEWGAKQICLVSGTPYHTRAAASVDFEEMLAKQLKCRYERKLNLLAHSWFRLQCRHKIGSSSVPYGSHTSPSRSKTWGVLNAAVSGGMAPHLSVFSHTHRWGYSEDFLGAVMVTPGWQALGGEYGDTACDGHVDVGAVQLRVGKTEAEGWSWSKRLYPAAAADRTVRL